MFIIHILKKHCNCNNISGILLGLNKDLPRLEGQKYEQGKFQKMCSLQRKKNGIYICIYLLCNRNFDRRSCTLFWSGSYGSDQSRAVPMQTWPHEYVNNKQAMTNKSNPFPLQKRNKLGNEYFLIINSLAVF